MCETTHKKRKKNVRSAIGIGKCICRRVGAKKSRVEREAL